MNKYYTYTPLTLLVLYIGKCLLLSVNTLSLENALVVASLAGLVGFYEYLQRNKKMGEIEKMVQEQNAVIEKQNDTLLAMAKKIGSIETSMTGVKLSQNIKTMNF